MRGDCSAFDESSFSSIFFRDLPSATVPATHAMTRVMPMMTPIAASLYRRTQSSTRDERTLGPSAEPAGESLAVETRAPQPVT